MPITEREIRNLLRAGDPRGLDALYDRLSPALFGFSLRLTGSRTMAEDLTQEVFLAAWSGRDSFRGTSTLHSWLLGIAVRRWRDQCRRRLPDTATLTEAVSESVPDGRVPLVDSVTDRVVLGDALMDLALPDREAVLLIIGQGLTYREAAVLLGEPVGTVKWRVAQATRRLRAKLGDIYSEGGTDDACLHSRSERADTTACRR